MHRASTVVIVMAANKKREQDGRKRRLVNAKMETKYKSKQRCVDFSALIYILFINVSTALTMAGSTLEINS